MYPWIYRQVLFPFYESFLRGRNTLKYLNELEKNQRLSKDELHDIQIRKLQKLMKHAYQNVPYYRAIFDKVNLKPEDITTFDDFRQFPFLSKQDIKKNKANLLAENYKGIDRVIDSTGGSTGELIEFEYSRDNYERRTASAIRGDEWSGWKLGERNTIIWGRHIVNETLIHRLKKSLDYTIKRFQYICSYNFSIDSIPKYIRMINKFKPALITSYTTPLYYIAKYIKDKGIACHSPKAIITSAEKLFDYQRSIIEYAFKARVFNRYGCTEVGFIAAECEKHNGMHINADNLIVEFVRNGKLVRPGEIGEIVITDLNNYLMPFIRYKIGDAGIPCDDTCNCGIRLPLMKELEGRTVDIIVTPDGRYIPGQLFQYMLDIVKGIEQFQVLQKEKHNIILKIVVNEDFQKNYLDILSDTLIQIIGKQIDLNIQIVDQIVPAKSGKYRYIMSEVPIDFENT